MSFLRKGRKNKMKKKIKTRYYTIHVNDGGDNGHSVFIEGDWAKKPTKDEILNWAWRFGQIDNEDRKYVDDVVEISKREYERATK